MTLDQRVRCDICGFDEARIRRVSRSYGKGDDLLVIEGVPIVSCLSCGESYLTAETLHEIERLKLHRHDLAEDREVEVVRFADPPGPISYGTMVKEADSELHGHDDDSEP